MLFLSILFALIPLAGIAMILATKSVTSVDGLFMSLILLTLSGVFFLNVLLEMKTRGWLGRKSEGGASKEPPAAKAS